MAKRTKLHVSGVRPQASVSGTELKMHGIARRSRPVAAPRETGTTKDGNDSRMHLTRGSLSVAFRIQVYGNSPGVGGKPRPSSLRTKREATPEASDLLLQTGVCNCLKTVSENRPHELVTSHARHLARVVPGKDDGRRW